MRGYNISAVTEQADVEMVIPPDTCDRRILSREKGQAHITNTTSTMLKYT
jgi:hypothetical protein